MASAGNRRDGLSWSQRVGYIIGPIYLAVGAAGFLVTGGLDFAATNGKSLVIFDVNPLHNIVHLGIGLALTLGARAGVGPSRSINLLVGIIYLGTAAAGFFAL